MFPERIETDNLIFKKPNLNRKTIKELYEVCRYDDSIDEVTKGLVWNPHKSLQETREFLDKIIEEFEERATLSLLIYSKESADSDKELAGITTLTLKWETRKAELGLWLRKKYWGNNYSGERAAALIQLAFEEYDLDVVEVRHTLDNHKSKKAIERYINRHGGERTGIIRNSIRIPNTGVHDDAVYAITDEEYEESKMNSIDAIENITYD